MYLFDIQLLALENQSNQNLSPTQYQRHGLVILVILGGFWQIMVFNFRTMNTNGCVNSSTLKCQKQQLKVCGLKNIVKDDIRTKSLLGQNPPGQNPSSVLHILLTVIYFINSSK